MAKGTGFTGLKVAPLVIPDGTTYTVQENHTGKIHILPDLTADITISLPAAFDGAYYEFWYSGTAADAQDWVINAVAGDLFYGGLVHLDTDAGSAGDEVVVVDADKSDDDTVTVLTPEAGTVVKMVSDGTVWYISGHVASATVPAFA
jgi:hypothetical protein